MCNCALKTIINASQGPEPGRTRAFLVRCLTKSSTHWPPQPPPPPPPTLQKPPLLLPYPPSHQAHGPRLLHHQSCNCGRTKKMLIEGSTGTQFDKQLCCNGLAKIILSRSSALWLSPQSCVPALSSTSNYIAQKKLFKKMLTNDINIYVNSFYMDL